MGIWYIVSGKHETHFVTHDCLNSALQTEIQQKETTPAKLKSPVSNFRTSHCQNKAMLFLVFFIKNTAVHMKNENRIKDE